MAESGRIVIDNSAPALDGNKYTLAEVVKPVAPPALAAIYPATHTIGGPDTLLRCLGTGFQKDARIVIANHVERTTWVSSEELTTWIESDLWTNPDPAVPVQVKTQAGLTTAKTLAIAA